MYRIFISQKQAPLGEEVSAIAGTTQPIYYSKIAVITFISIVIGKKRKNQCGTCLGCSVKDCTTCHFCKDMKKYGGPGQLKQAALNPSVWKIIKILFIVRISIIFL